MPLALVRLSDGTDAPRPTLLADVRALSVEVAAFNSRAVGAGSARGVRLGIVPLRVEPDHESAAREIARTVRETMAELRAALRAGDRKRIDVVLRRCSNLHKLAVGMQGEAVRFAVEQGRASRKAIGEAVKAGQTEASAGRGAGVDMIEACEGLFAEMDGGAS